MTTTISDLPALEIELTELKEARHKLLTGKMRVQVMVNHGGNNSVTNQQISMSDLNARISELTNTIARLKGTGRTAFHWS